MPYVNKVAREELKERSPQDSGELNYLITTMLIQYIKDKGLSYQSCNDVMGALTGAQQEFYRRVVIKYENQKIEVNGDVYDI